MIKFKCDSLLAAVYYLTYSLPSVNSRPGPEAAYRGFLPAEQAAAGSMPGTINRKKKISLLCDKFTTIVLKSSAGIDRPLQEAQP